MTGYEDQGSGFDPFALGYEMQGRGIVSRPTSQWRISMKREEMIAMAEDAGIKVDSRWSDETLAKKLADPTEPVESDDEIKVENILNSMGNSHVKVICTCDNVYLGDLRLTVKRKGAMVENVEFLINRDTCDMPETLANFLEAREQVAII